MSLISILKLKCPACEKAFMFETESKFLSFNFNMHQNCPECNERFYKEPGFYFGAMFISYIVSGIISLLFVGVLIIGLKMNWVSSLVILFVVMAFCFSYLFKVSRAIWLSFFVKKK